MSGGGIVSLGLL